MTAWGKDSLTIFVIARLALRQGVAIYFCLFVLRKDLIFLLLRQFIKLHRNDEVEHRFALKKHESSRI